METLCFFICLFVFLFVLFLIKELYKIRYLYNLSKKAETFNDIENIAELFSNELQQLTSAELIAVIEYKYSGSRLLASFPVKNLSNDVLSFQEVFLVLKTLFKENSDFINQNNLKSEHICKYFPFFRYTKFKIIPLYISEEKIYTLEFYGDLGISLNLGLSLVDEVVNLFRKELFSQIKFNNDIFELKMNNRVIEFLDRIRNSLDENELRAVILKEIVDTFDADRGFFIQCEKKSPFSPLLAEEYLANPYVKSLRGNKLDYLSVWEQLRKDEILPPFFVIENAENFIRNKNLADTPIANFIKESEIKSSYPFVVYEDESHILYLVLQYTKCFYLFSQDDFRVMSLLTKQTNVALIQAKIYTKLLLSSKEEKLLIDLIDVLNRSFSFQKISNEFVSLIGLFFGAQRCLLRFYDAENQMFTNLSEVVEYKNNYDVLTAKNSNIQHDITDFLLNSQKSHNVLVVNYSHDLLNSYFEYKDAFIEYFSYFNIKTYMAVFLRFGDKLFGVLSLHFFNDITISQEKKDFFMVVANQMASAFYQIELYENSQNEAQKEKLLNEIYFDGLFFRDVKQLYRYFAKKFSVIFNAAGVVFCEHNSSDIIKLSEYYFANNKISLFKNYPDIMDFVFTQKNYSLYNLSDFKELESFVKKSGVRFLGTIPLDKNLLAFLFFDKNVKFTPFDKKLLKMLANAYTRVYLDIKQRTEIEKLRDNFLSVLQHDLQVPIIAQRNAINYISSKISDANFLDLLRDLSISNSQVENIIKILGEIYKFEAKQKELLMSLYNISVIIGDFIGKTEKDISFEKLYIDENVRVFVDKLEVERIFEIFTAEILPVGKGKIFVETIIENYCVRCYFYSSHSKVNNYKKLILYENIDIHQNLSRKVGEGLNLHLAKLIAFAHGGKIYINENIHEEKVFCLELPFV